MKKQHLLAGVLLLMTNIAFAAGERVDIGSFSTGSLKGWESKELGDKTTYEIQQQGNRTVLAAKSESTKGASLIGFRKRIDLTKTPFLNWRWKVDKALPPLKEATRAGDDFAARVYVIIDGGLFIWKTRALNYVWSSNSGVAGQKWNNPFKPKNARMLAIRDSRHPAGQWFTEKQDVAADFKHLFGFTPRFIDGVAVMTDADNSKGTAAASFGDIFFTQQ